MKIPNSLIECHIDPRVLDLAARLEPVFNEWAKTNLNPGEDFEILVTPSDMSAGTHRMRVNHGSDGGGGLKLPAHKISNTQPSPEGVQ